MKLSLRAITLILALLAAAATAAADPVTLTLNNGGSNVMGGVYVGPYNFTETGNGAPVTLQLVCDDFQDNVFAGEQWSAVTSTFPSLSNVQFSGSSQGYLEIAWLVQQMSAHIGNAEIVGQLQWAIWDVFDPGISGHDPYGTISSYDQSQISNWLQMALDAATNNQVGGLSGLTIYTPVPGSQVPSTDGPPQEYFDPVPAPEPGSLMLIGSGLLGLMAFRRRLSL